MKRLVPMLLLAALPANATVYQVTKTADTFDGACDRDCSLREAISAANLPENSGHADVVVVPAGIYRLTLPGPGEDGNGAGDLDLNDSMILVGAGPGSTVLSGEGLDRVLDVRSTVEIFGVTVREGRVDGDGGGILVRPSFTSELLLHRSVVVANEAEGDGGGIATQAHLEVRDSAVLDNRAGANGGGIGANVGSVALTNVTLSGNRAEGMGGGLEYAIDRATALSGMTIVFNQAGLSGGGIVSRPPLAPGEFAEVIGSIVAENLAPAGQDCDDIVSGGYNVLGPGCDRRSTDRLGEIGKVVFRVPRTDLGPTPVHELLLNSPALDFVQSCEAGDQVGQARQAPCDAGAWEKTARPVCVPGGSILCLQGGRFRVSAAFGPDEEPAVAAPLTDDTGNYWFFSPENLEVMVKVLNGCGLNQRWWVFSSGLTNVGVTLRVEDLETGRTWVNIQPPGQTYQPRLDTAAFPCALAQASEAPSPGEPGPATAVLVVSKTEDTFDAICNHDCSLRDAVFAANLGEDLNVIVLEPRVYTLGIVGSGEDGAQTGDLDVSAPLLLLGAGAGRTILDGGGIDRVLDVRKTGTLTLHDATVRNGAPPAAESGGGIRSAGLLTLLRSAVEDNQALWGGGILSFVQLTLRDSTVSGNEAEVIGGGIYADGVVEMENATVSGNQAGEAGGGLFIGLFSAVLRNVTVTANSAPITGGLHADLVFECPGGPCPGTLELHRNVVAGNLGSNSPDCQVVQYSGGYNVFGVGAGCLPAASDKAGTTVHPLDPKLSPLGDHGGPTPTHLPLAGSPVLDLAPSCSATDQRGKPRPSGLCDAGAVEVLPGCQPDEETLCLGDRDRFRVTARWTAQGNSGPGRPLPLALDTGSFWFFDPANVELTVKVLNGCGVNQRYWVFLSGLTNVGVEVRVEDTKTGETWTHNHAAGTPLQPRLATDALEVCP